MHTLSHFLSSIQWIWVGMIYYGVACVAAFAWGIYSLWLTHPWWLAGLLLAAVLIIDLAIWVESTGE